MKILIYLLFRGIIEEKHYKLRNKYTYYLQVNEISFYK